MDGNPYVFLDESGDFAFGGQGSAYFIVTAVTMRRPIGIDSDLAAYRYECLDAGWDAEYFHCSRDKPVVRDRVFEIIAGHRDRMRIDCLVVEKARIERSFRPTVLFYPRVVGRLLNETIPKTDADEGQRIVVVTDRLPVKRAATAVEKGIRATLATVVCDRRPVVVHHHQSRSHFGLQVADYCCWAIQRKWERHDERYYALVEPALRLTLRGEGGMESANRDVTKNHFHSRLPNARPDNHRDRNDPFALDASPGRPEN